MLNFCENQDKIIFKMSTTLAVKVQGSPELSDREYSDLKVKRLKVKVFIMSNAGFYLYLYRF